MINHHLNKFKIYVKLLDLILKVLLLLMIHLIIKEDWNLLEMVGLIWLVLEDCISIILILLKD
jgi:hypothetical protein